MIVADGNMFLKRDDRIGERIQFLNRILFPTNGHLELLVPLIRLINFTTYLKYFWIGFIFLNILIIISQIIFMVKVRGNLVKLMEVNITLTFVVQAVYKLWTLYYKQDALEDMFNTTNKKFFNTSNIKGKYKRQIKQLLKRTSLFIYSHMFYCMAVSFYLMLSPISGSTDGTRPLPIQTWLPFDTNQSPTYEIVTFLLTVDTFFIVYTDAMFDYCLLFLAQHLLMQFLILKYMLANIVEDGNLDHQFHSDSFQKNLFEKVRDCVQHHCLLLKFGKKLSKFGSLSLGIQLMFIILIMVVIEFLIYWDIENKLRCFKLILMFLAIFGQLVLYAYVGSELQATSVDIATAAFHSRWYSGRKQVGDALGLMQLNAQKELKITASIFTVVNYGTIISVSKTAFSIFTLLRSIQERDSS